MTRFQIALIIYLTILTTAMGLLWRSQILMVRQLPGRVSFIPNPTVRLSPSPIATTSAPLAPLQAQVDQLTRRLDILEGLPTATPVTTAKAQSAPFQTQVLTLGSASTTNRNWNATGLEISLNSNDYPANVNAFFEAGLNISGGISWARLTNKTTGAIINLTEVSHDTNTVTWKRSPAFKLHPGKNTYIVEMRSSSGEVAYLNSSRIVIEKP